MSMKWIITHDANPEEAADGGLRSWVDTSRGFTEQEREAIRRALPEQRLALFDALGLNFEFQLEDDDGNVLLHGRCKDLDQQDGDAAFAPMDFFAERIGTTAMLYRKGDGGSFEGPWIDL